MNFYQYYMNLGHLALESGDKILANYYFNLAEGG